MADENMDWNVELYDKIDWYWMRYHLIKTSRRKLDGSLDEEYAESRKEIMVDYKKFILAEAERIESEAKSSN